MRKVLAPESAGTFFLFVSTIEYFITGLTSKIPEDRQE